MMFISVCALSQTKIKLINPKGKWYFGAEVGLNKITSFSYGEANNSMSFGGIVEYYFGKHWSVQGKVKYIKTGVSFINQPDNGWDFGWIKTTQDVASSPVYNRFDGKAIVIPIDIKWEYRIHKNLHGIVKIGPSLTIETESNYAYGNVDYSTFSKTFVTMNSGFGFNYYISKRYGVGVEFENYFLGDSKGTTSGFLWNKTHYATNSLFNLQLKYHF